VVENLPRKHKALSLNHISPKIKLKKEMYTANCLRTNFPSIECAFTESLDRVARVSQKKILFSGVIQKRTYRIHRKILA
jgi:hypothetical protein